MQTASEVSGNTPADKSATEAGADTITTRTGSVVRIPPRRPRFTSGPKLHGNRFKGAEYHRNHWFADIPSGITKDMAMEPTYWAHHASHIKPMDRIEAFCEDGSWEALFRVMYVDKIGVELRVIYENQYDSPNVTKSPLTEYDVKWKGPAMNWLVFNKALGDKNGKIKDRFVTEKDADAYVIKLKESGTGRIVSEG